MCAYISIPVGNQQKLYQLTYHFQVGFILVIPGTERQNLKNYLKLKITSKEEGK